MRSNTKSMLAIFIAALQQSQREKLNSVPDVQKAEAQRKAEGSTCQGKGGKHQQTCLGRRLPGSSRRDWPGSALAASPPHPGHRTHSAQRESETQGEHHPPGWGIMTTGGAQQAPLRRARLLLYPSLKVTSCVTLDKLLNHSDPQLHHR